MRLVELQRLGAQNAARIALGHCRADVDALGEPSDRPQSPCSCGERCHAVGYRCRGQATLVVPGAVVEIHACAVHLIEVLSSQSPWWYS